MVGIDVIGLGALLFVLGWIGFCIWCCVWAWLDGGE